MGNDNNNRDYLLRSSNDTLLATDGLTAYHELLSLSLISRLTTLEKTRSPSPVGSVCRYQKLYICDSYHRSIAMG